MPNHDRKVRWGSGEWHRGRKAYREWGLKLDFNAGCKSQQMDTREKKKMVPLLRKEWVKRHASLTVSRPKAVWLTWLSPWECWLKISEYLRPGHRLSQPHPVYSPGLGKGLRIFLSSSFLSRYSLMEHPKYNLWAGKKNWKNFKLWLSHIYFLPILEA